MKNYHDDPRFRIAHREALIGLGLAIINFYNMVRICLWAW